MIGNATDIVTYLMNASKEKPDVKWELKEYKEPRSGRQNRYYWTLIREVAEKRKHSTAYVHNTQLRAARYAKRVEGELMVVKVPDTDEAERQIMEADDYHLAPIKKWDGDKRLYVMLRGSSELNTKEMGHLLDLLIQDAQSIGIETLTPREIAEFRMYDQKQEDKRNAKAINSN